MLAVMSVVVLLFVYCKQKRAYEVRISDWIPDVCSSDLEIGEVALEHHLLRSATVFKRDLADFKTILDFCEVVKSPERLRLLLVLTVVDIRAVGPGVWNGWKRSEEHTSELQSLMRISYALFCL